MERHPEVLGHHHGSGQHRGPLQIPHTAGAPHMVALTWEHNGLRLLTQTERILAADAP
ncbi:hypothetical protein [Streptomyces sp. NPDC059979]|uniref:hypothetical protein n=1 Tax=unclassified Streptomyces TaxID=2593676 RepID=UPI00365D6238